MRDVIMLPWEKNTFCCRIGNNLNRCPSRYPPASGSCLSFLFVPDLRGTDKRNWVIANWAQVARGYVRFSVVVHCLCCMCVQMLSPSCLPWVFVCRLCPWVDFPWPSITTRVIVPYCLLIPIPLILVRCTFSIPVCSAFFSVPFVFVC